MYVIGYAGKTVTREELLAWSQFKELDPEYQRRVLALMDASIAAGRPVGLGGIWRSFDQAVDLAMSRHHHVLPGQGCCIWEGKSYLVNAGMAHAAFPGLTYHMDTTPDGRCLAIDFIGDLKWLGEHAGEYHLWIMPTEPWHGQPDSIPHSKRYYVASQHHPLPVIQLPGLPPANPTQVFAPKAPLSQAKRKVQSAEEVRHLQLLCNFWKWTDSYGMRLLVDGDYGPKTEQAVRAMQRALKIVVDGWYGNQSMAALQKFLDAMAGLAK